ncbi:MAG: serine protease [Nanoarchaeota archaeon]|nr:serine protease [Nanoarchaeota archaeon]
MSRPNGLGLAAIVVASALASKDSAQQQDRGYTDGTFVVLQAPSQEERNALERMLKIVPVPKEDNAPRQVNIDTPELIFEGPIEGYRGQVRIKQPGHLTTGNGILLNQEGYIITNHHVIARTIAAFQNGELNTRAVFYSPKQRFVAFLEPVAYSIGYDVALAKVTVPRQCSVPDTIIAEQKNFEGSWVGLSRVKDPPSTSAFFIGQILPLISYDVGAKQWGITQTAPLDFDPRYATTLGHGFVVDVKSADASFQESGRLCYALPANSNDPHPAPSASRDYVVEGNSGAPVFNAYHQLMGLVLGEATITGANKEVIVLPDFVGPKPVRALINAALQKAR